ncbi:MAG: hypothetical protein LBC82_02145 [Oscillospiraceae bacterium]|nr:hypothetical protein [Oscillospiraceae bacterium]
MKKITAVLIILIVVLFVTACSSSPEFTAEEKFAARANVTINRGIWEYPELKNSVNYTFITLEYYMADGARVIRADCSVRLVFEDSGDEFVRVVFLLSDTKAYLDNFIIGEKINAGVGYIALTEMYYANLSNFEFTPNEENLVDRVNTNKLADLYVRTRNKSYLGME